MLKQDRGEKNLGPGSGTWMSGTLMVCHLKIVLSVA